MGGREQKDAEEKAADRAEATLEMGDGERRAATVTGGRKSRSALAWALR